MLKRIQGNSVCCSFLILFIAGGIALFFQRSSWADEVSVVLKEKEGVYFLEGRFFVKAPLQAAWEVLVDYDHIGEFVSSIRKSVVKERRGDYLLLEQAARASFFFLFSKNIYVLLKVREEPYRRIDFEDISHKDFAFYKGSWAIKENDKGLEIFYATQASPRFNSPSFIAKRGFVKSAKSLLSEVRLEIFRRNKAP